MEAGVAVATLAVATAAGAQPSSSPIEQGDAAYAAFDNPAALERYQAALEESPRSAEALWKAARAHADVGAAREPEDRETAKRHYAEAGRLARLAIEERPDSADAHFVLAMSLGRRAQLEGGRGRIRLSREVRSEAERALELDPEHDGSHHVMGRWHYEIARVGWLQRAFAKIIYGGVPPGASLEQAAEHFAKAIEIDPARPVHHLEYARTLLELGRVEEAREHLRTCLELPQVQWDDPETRQQARRLLAESRAR